MGSPSQRLSPFPKIPECPTPVRQHITLHTFIFSVAHRSSRPPSLCIPARVTSWLPRTSTHRGVVSVVSRQRCQSEAPSLPLASRAQCRQAHEASPTWGPGRFCMGGTGREPLDTFPMTLCFFSSPIASLPKFADQNTCCACLKCAPTLRHTVATVHQTDLGWCTHFTSRI